MSVFPRPDFERSNWMSLNGEWEFDFDENRKITEQEWIMQSKFSMNIQVPYVYQSNLSGIQDTTMHDIVWYTREFEIPEALKGKTILLKFGAVDYETHVWLNSQYLGMHQGGYTPFEFNISENVKDNGNRLTIKVIDKADVAQPRGKQYWKQETNRCWYIQSTGIWQSVWLEGVEERPINSIHLTPDIDTGTVKVAIKVDEYRAGDEIRFTISYQHKQVKIVTATLDGVRSTVIIALQPEDFIDESHYWTPEHPNLYDMKVELLNVGQISDIVYTYFGMRKITISDGKILLNNTPYYMKMVLDQGYWADGILTPPNDEALKKDVEITKQFGFNGSRKHQKIEDPRYYYWADKLGLIVWGEVPSTYEFSADSIKNLTRDFIDFMDRDYNHPSIVAWVPFNESWGVRKILNDENQVHFGESLYYIAKAYDGSRLVSTNDGWENVKSDIIGIHDYHMEGSYFEETYSEEAIECPELFNSAGRRVFSEKYYHESKKTAFMMTEYGGIAMKTNVDDVNWGYGEAEAGEESLLRRYETVTQAISKNQKMCGYCYTQLTDVYQEVNGLTDMNHVPKFSPEKLYQINNIEGKK